MASELSVVLDGGVPMGTPPVMMMKMARDLLVRSQEGGRRRRQHHGPEQPSRMSKHLALCLVLGMEHQSLGFQLSVVFISLFELNNYNYIIING